MPSNKKRNAKYCNRKSKLKGYENKDCATAKRLALKKLKKRENNVLTYLEIFCDKPKVRKEFKQKYEKFFKQVQNKPTIKNLEKLDNVLSKKYIKDNYYKYNAMTGAEIIKIMYPK